MGSSDSTNRVLTIPNALTLVRFLLVGLMAWLFVRGQPEWSMAVYLLAAATDLVDGFIARRLNQISNLGKVMDPIADKLMTITALVCMFIINDKLPIGVLIVVVIKEALMVLGGVLIYFVFKKVVYANLYGKIAAAAYFLAIMLLFLDEYLRPYDVYFMYVAVAMNVISMIQYGYINIVMNIKRSKPNRNESPDD